MQVDGEEQSLSIRFRELPYTVETGEAEMIGIDTVARTARNAAALDSTTATASSRQKDSKKEKQASSTDLLSPEEEERKDVSAQIPFKANMYLVPSCRFPQHPSKCYPNP
jgi:hypothetical protein